MTTPQGNSINFTFSDTIAGYVTQFNPEQNQFTLRTSDGRFFQVNLKGNTYAYLARNLGDPYLDATGQIHDMLEEGRYMYAYGVYYPEHGTHVFEAQFLVFVGRKADEYFFEKQNWWIKQLSEIAHFYRRAQFGKGEIDYRNYRTTINLSGERTRDNFIQETDTISRLVYGYASAYLLTGEDEFLEIAEKGTEYLRGHMRFYDRDENIVYWYHGIRIQGDKEEKLFTSEFGDDYDAIPAYEQIYALAGPIQTYRISGDPRILKDAELTIDLFDRFFLDQEKGGYYSHLDPITLDPLSDALGPNKGKKNWNSVGDHAPAYLINLVLATDEPRFKTFLEGTFDTIARYFPDYENSPFVQEKFFSDWSHDQQHMWQQNRGVVGHNLKIAWNIMRMHTQAPKPEYEALARKIAAEMPLVGGDRQHGGWYDVMERVKQDDQEWHRFAFHDRKAWWQQEQGILAYLILHGLLKDEEYLRIARESQAFYNAWFLDHDDGAVYFNTLANGLPYLLGTERLKGSHSMSMYHSSELCYLSAVYNNLLIFKKPLDMHFKPIPGGFKDNILRVAPDLLPPGSVKISSVTLNEQPYSNFDADALTVTLPETDERVKICVTLQPV
ncbi:AGE family epimerase/isomerase [Deinococcus misasensis]|uniref:AGE family epimerase/isomerase n=1 Tax=Deinococcus misasensis TaxID=392413 RepID=UPI000550A10A|nr:AGE family epimerase/isomerase [Deinococcus misasensis]